MAAQLSPLLDKPDSLTQLVYESLRDAIVHKTLAPGTRVTEASLARQLQVSKTPVREALLRLHAVGLVQSDGNRGPRIVEPSEAAIIDAYEVRAVLESAIARFAAQRSSADEQAAFRHAAEQSLERATAGDIAGFRRWDRVFHRALADSTGNRRLTELSDNAVMLTSALRQRDVPAGGDSIKCARLHVQIAKAVQRRDQERAAEYAVMHVNEVREIVLRAMRESAELQKARVVDGA